MSTREPWAELDIAVSLAIHMADEVRGLARPIFERLGEIDANAYESSNFGRDRAWCADVACALETARRVLRSLHDEMPEEWR